MATTEDGFGFATWLGRACSNSLVDAAASHIENGVDDILFCILYI